MDTGQAFTIFSGYHLGLPEAQTALKALTEEETLEFEQHVGVFLERLEEYSARAYTELGQITAEHGLHLKPTDQRDWTLQDYVDALEAFRGSEFEQIHVDNLAHVPATKALLALVKP